MLLMSRASFSAVTSMHRSWALRALALALLLGAASTPAPAPAAVTNCTLLAKSSSERWGWRPISQSGRATNVTLIWNSEPAHAATALLAALLRHVLLYDGVYLSLNKSQRLTAKLATSLPFNMHGDYKEFIISLSTTWMEGAMPWLLRKRMRVGLAGRRLKEFGVRLHAHLSPHASQLPHCKRHVRWSFYADRRALVDCDFVDANAKDPAVEVLAVGDCNDCNDTVRLQERASASNTMLSVRRVDRAYFLHTLHTANHSLLFLDYDMWEKADGVSAVEPPPCNIVDFHCKQELDSTIAMRVADIDSLQTYSPQLYKFVHDFNPPPKSLRYILERQASGVDIEEAACEWALKTKSNVVNKEHLMIHYVVSTYICHEDPDHAFIIKLPKIVQDEVRNQTLAAGWDVKMYIFNINCSDHLHLSKEIHKMRSTFGYYRTLGIVSLSAEGLAEAMAATTATFMPLMLAAVAPEYSCAVDTTWRVAGRPRLIALALCHFVRQSGWTRVAVLSQDTKLAADYYAALKQDAKIFFRNFNISDGTKQKAQAVLQDLRDTNARIVFINTDSTAANIILTAAVAGGMGYSDGFVWIVREWRQDNTTLCATQHFTVSLWSRGVEDLPPTEHWGSLRETMRRRQPWPPRAVSLVDALLSLAIGFIDVFQRNPELHQYIHSEQMIKSLKESLISKPVTGVSQRLQYAEHSIEETFVFVDKWCGGRFKRRLATWRVNSTSGAVRGNYSRPEMPRHDGASRCVVRSGDAFQPTCHDVECACALLLLALAPGAALLVRYELRRRLARLLHEQQTQMIARRWHVAAVLAAHLVERAALELREELGAGRFGSVRLARLQQPGRAPRYIAAKALRDNAAPAEESDFLREACTIASLEHAHIVRLVGVCIADGPPLVLMELAFFGDLLGYLRERRHLLDGAGSEEALVSGEVEHVSAEALTRLAHEAAQALQYLGARGVVHCDVRAANCLVDERRSLKLADFGMARDTVAGVEGATEYTCRRRGLFPVLWMAPESLANGVFSAASDVWALGVLLLELVTLGARPYGSMSPLRVLEYVVGGGSPPLPPAATPQTRGLARLCWARVADQRPQAAQVAAYLAARPRALCPALVSERAVSADPDSGFGESPSTKLLPPDSPLRSFDQRDDLVATH